MVCSFNFNVVVADCYQICDCIMLQQLIRFKEGSDLPLLVVMGIELFEARTCTDDCNTTCYLSFYFGEEACRTHLDPSFSCISNDEGHVG